MAASLAPSLLLSMPQLLDENFCRTVVLLCKHNAEGAFGLFVNRQLLTTKRELVLEGNPPANARLIAGYAGWGPGQLEAELNASAWLIGEVDRELIFNTPADRM